MRRTVLNCVRLISGSLLLFSTMAFSQQKTQAFHTYYVNEGDCCDPDFYYSYIGDDLCRKKTKSMPDSLKGFGEVFWLADESKVNLIDFSPNGSYDHDATGSHFIPGKFSAHTKERYRRCSPAYLLYDPNNPYPDCRAKRWQDENGKSDGTWTLTAYTKIREEGDETSNRCTVFETGCEWLCFK